MGFSTVPCNEFVEVLGSKAPVPGGGGASALVGAIGTALGNMVGSLTVGKKKYADVRTRIDYEAFVNSSHEEQVEICRKNIEGAAKYIAEKDSSFKLDDFLRDLNA